jgi:hypothetical protein
MEEACRGRGRKQRKRVGLLEKGCNACQPNDLCCLSSRCDQADDEMVTVYSRKTIDSAGTLGARPSRANVDCNEAECVSSIYDDVICENCQGGHDEDRMLLCDKCDRGFHMYCLSPVAISVPEDDWLCPLCVRRAEVRGKYNFFPFTST